MLPLAHLLTGPDNHGGALLRHHTPRARSVIFLYMDGAPSCHDLFDFKERLVKENGKPFGMPMEPTQFNDRGHTLGPCGKFQQHGDSGQWISDFLPHTAKMADRLCVVRSMYANFSEHTNANYFLHTGHGLQGRPSLGAWVGYGLGSDNDNLPAFLVLNGGLIPPGGASNFHSGYLPAHSQGSVLAVTGDPLPNVTPREQQQGVQRRKLDLITALDEHSRRELGNPDQIEAARPGKPRGRRAGKLRSKRHRMKKVPKVTLSADSDRHTYEQKYGKQQRRWT